MKKMNKKGQQFFVGFMLFVSGLIVLFALISFIQDEIAIVRNANNLDCTNTSISTMTKATCIVTDTALFTYTGVGIGALLAAIGGGLMINQRRQT